MCESGFVDREPRRPNRTTLPMTSEFCASLASSMKNGSECRDRWRGKLASTSPKTCPDSRSAAAYTLNHSNGRDACAARKTSLCVRRPRSQASERVYWEPVSHHVYGCKVNSVYACGFGHPSTAASREGAEMKTMKVLVRDGAKSGGPLREASMPGLPKAKRLRGS